MKTFLTEYDFGGMRLGDAIQADSFAEAEQVAAARGRGETITGELIAPIPVERMDTDRARRIIAALNDRRQGTMH